MVRSSKAFCPRQNRLAVPILGNTGEDLVTLSSGVLGRVVPSSKWSVAILILLNWSIMFCVVTRTTRRSPPAHDEPD